MSFENYITKEEASIPRNPKEFIDWFKEKLRITKEYRDELKKQNLLHEGIAKIFYEELFPLYRLLQCKEKEWHDTRIMYVYGNQNFDVEIISSRQDIPRFIEITQSDMNKEEYLRMKYFLEKGSVSMIGSVLKEGNKKTGLKISVEEIATDHSEWNLKKKEQIN
jgi:hypothetical protein